MNNGIGHTTHQPTRINSTRDLHWPSFIYWKGCMDLFLHRKTCINFCFLIFNLIFILGALFALNLVISLELERIMNHEPGNWEGSALCGLGRGWSRGCASGRGWRPPPLIITGSPTQGRARQCIADTSRGQGLLITRDLILPMAACLSDAMGSGIIIRRLCFQFQTGER